MTGTRPARAPRSRAAAGGRPGPRETSFRHALALAERLRTPKEAERLLAVAVANDDRSLAQALLFQARSRGWELIVGRLARRLAEHEDADEAVASAC